MFHFWGDTQSETQGSQESVGRVRYIFRLAEVAIRSKLLLFIIADEVRSLGLKYYVGGKRWGRSLEIVSS